MSCKRNWSVSDSHITNKQEILLQIDEIIMSLSPPIRVGLGSLGQEHAVTRHYVPPRYHLHLIFYPVQDTWRDAILPRWKVTVDMAVEKQPCLYHRDLK